MNNNTQIDMSTVVKNIKSFVLNKDLNEIKKGSVFKRDSVGDEFVSEYQSDDFTFITFISNEAAILNLINRDKDYITILDVFIESNNDENKSHIKRVMKKAKKRARRLANEFVKVFTQNAPHVSDCTCNDCNILRQELLNKDYNYNNKKREFLLKQYSDRYVNITKEINTLLLKYQEEFNNIDIVDELEFDKIEQATVLENMITLLRHLKSTL